MRLIDAEPYDELLKQRSEQLRNEMGSLGGAVSGCRKLLAIQPTIDPVHAAGACRCHECIYGIRCEDDPLYEGDPDDFRYQCVEGAEYDSVSGLYIGFTSYHSADFFCANGERRNENV